MYMYTHTNTNIYTCQYLYFCTSKESKLRALGRYASKIVMVATQGVANTEAGRHKKSPTL